MLKKIGIKVIGGYDSNLKFKSLFITVDRFPSSLKFYSNKNELDFTPFTKEIINIENHENLSQDNNIPINSSTKSAKLYYDLLSIHKQMKIPFVDENYYKDLFEISCRISNSSADFESWYIIQRYGELNVENIDKEFLCDIINQFANIKISDFEFWYYVEKE